MMLIYEKSWKNYVQYILGYELIYELKYGTLSASVDVIINGRN